MDPDWPARVGLWSTRQPAGNWESRDASAVMRPCCRLTAPSQTGKKDNAKQKHPAPVSGRLATHWLRAGYRLGKRFVVLSIGKLFAKEHVGGNY